MLARDQYHEEDFIHNEGDFSVRLIEEALKRWLSDLEMHLHACDEDHASLQVRIVERVGELVQSLPPWNGQFPGGGDPAQDPDGEELGTFSIAPDPAPPPPDETIVMPD